MHLMVMTQNHDARLVVLKDARPEPAFTGQIDSFI
jgi:hypothetical protein